MKREITEDGIIFWVENGRLESLVNNGEAKSVVIPNKFASGIEITFIDSSVCKGKFDKITISDEITDISENAFAYSAVKEVNWSKGCRVIPSHCFFHSTVEAVHGIENVEIIEEQAFMETKHLKRLRWPDKCNAIPQWCFYCSAIKKISNTKNVIWIGCYAFFQTNLTKFEWPTGCKKIPDSCFAGSALEEISNIEEVERINFKAFFATKIKKFHWPPKCKRIPDQCFCSCAELTEILNTENVEEVGKSAFEATNIESFVWPDKCHIIPNSCFYHSPLKGISNISNVSIIEAYAFGRTSFDTANKLDLSESIISTIEEKVFAGLDREAVLFSYYLAENIEPAFLEELD